LFHQNKKANVKHFCQRCREYSRKELLERHKPERKGLLKRPTRTELPEEGKNKLFFKKSSMQQKMPSVIYSCPTKLHVTMPKGIMGNGSL